MDGSPLVLVVDDEPGVVRLVREVLRRAGFDVLSAASAEQALSVVAHHAGTIDAALLDVMLPDTPGLELYPELSRLRPGLRVAFMGGYPSELVVGSKLAGVPFVPKPFDPRELVSIVRRLLD